MIRFMLRKFCSIILVEFRCCSILIKHHRRQHHKRFDIFKLCFPIVLHEFGCSLIEHSLETLLVHSCTMNLVLLSHFVLHSWIYVQRHPRL
ncbi:uncharacterized protein DS421_12g354570 [Arachis hypogaea]|nr:uncharacterized protein DS421_12g354570 [Arachis hypogaea]